MCILCIRPNVGAARLQRGVRARDEKANGGRGPYRRLREGAREEGRLGEGYTQRGGRGSIVGAAAAAAAAAADGWTGGEAAKGKCYAIKRLHIKS